MDTIGDGEGYGWFHMSDYGRPCTKRVCLNMHWFIHMVSVLRESLAWSEMKVSVRTTYLCFVKYFRAVLKISWSTFLIMRYHDYTAVKFRWRCFFMELEFDLLQILSYNISNKGRNCQIHRWRFARSHWWQRFGLWLWYKEKIYYDNNSTRSEILPQSKDYHHPQTLVPGELPTGRNRRMGGSLYHPAAQFFRPIPLPVRQPEWFPSCPQLRWCTKKIGHLRQQLPSRGWRFAGGGLPYHANRRCAHPWLLHFASADFIHEEGAKEEDHHRRRGRERGVCIYWRGPLRAARGWRTFLRHLFFSLPL